EHGEVEAEFFRHGYLPGCADVVVQRELEHVAGALRVGDAHDAWVCVVVLLNTDVTGAEVTRIDERLDHDESARTHMPGHRPHGSAQHLFGDQMADGREQACHRVVVAFELEVGHICLVEDQVRTSPAGDCQLGRR